MNQAVAENKSLQFAGYAEELSSTGSVLIPAGIVFSAEEIVRLEGLQAQIPEETVTAGDAGDTHDIYVRRIMLDRAGELPTLVNQPFSTSMVEILEGETRRQAIAELFGSSDPFHIRRCQMNRMTAGSFIGIHLDAASNPDYDYSMIVQLGRGYEGGEFVVHSDDGRQRSYVASYGSVLLTTCKYRHEVTRVLSGERNSLVYFYSRHAGQNRRDQ